MYGVCNSEDVDSMQECPEGKFIHICGFCPALPPSGMTWLNVI